MDFGFFWGSSGPHLVELSSIWALHSSALDCNSYLLCRSVLYYCSLNISRSIGWNIEFHVGRLGISIQWHHVSFLKTSPRTNDALINTEEICWTIFLMAIRVGLGWWFWELRLHFEQDFWSFTQENVWGTQAFSWLVQSSGDSFVLVLARSYSPGLFHHALSLRI